MKPYVGIEAMSAYLPEETASLEQLQARGMLSGSPQTLRSFGCERVHRFSVKVPPGIDVHFVDQQLVTECCGRYF